MRVLRVVIYARVSHDPNKLTRSVNEQLIECRAFASRNGWRVVAEFVDNDISASRYSRKSRPEYEKLKRFLQDGSADVLLIWESSRSTRDLEDFVALRKICIAQGIMYSYGGKIFDLDRTDDRFSTGLDALLAERESDQVRDRVLRSMRHAAQQGRPHGKIPFGYDRLYTAGKLVEQVVNEEKAALIREIAKRILDGDSCYAIAKELNERGIPSPAGSVWIGSQVKRAVTLPNVAGMRVHQGQIVGRGLWEPILDEDTWRRCCALMDDPRRLTHKDSNLKHLLSHTALCGPCGAYLKVFKVRQLPSYVCPKKFCVGIKATRLTDYIEEVFLEYMSRTDLFELFHAKSPDGGASQTRDEVAALRQRLDGFYDAAARGELTPGALAKIEARLLPEIASAEERLREVSLPSPLRHFITDSPDMWAQSEVELRRAIVAGVWADLEIGQRRAAVAAAMRIHVDRVGKGHRTFRPERIRIEWL